MEGFQDITQCRQAYIVDELQRHADTVIAAHWGDVWMDDMGLLGAESEVQSPNAVSEFAYKKMFKKGSEWLLKNLCDPQITTERAESLLKGTVGDELAGLANIEDIDFRVKAFKTNQWSFRWTLASIRMFQAAAFPRLPFYDTRIADFFCTVPTQYVSHRKLQIDYLKRFAPDLARINWQVYNANLYMYPYYNSLLLPQRIINKTWRTIRKKKILERNWEVQFLNKRGKEGLSQWLVRPGLHLHEFISPQVLQSLLDDFFMRPVSSKGYTVSMLLTFSAWLERYGQ